MQLLAGDAQMILEKYFGIGKIKRWMMVIVMGMMVMVMELMTHNPLVSNTQEKPPLPEIQCQQ